MQILRAGEGRRSEKGRMEERDEEGDRGRGRERSRKRKREEESEKERREVSNRCSAIAGTLISVCVHYKEEERAANETK